MRLDKFLKISLIFKTRSSGEKLIEKGKILINGKTAKPASDVKIGDSISIEYPFKKITYQVLNISEKNVSKKDAKELIKQTGEEKIDF